jgi:hypothetical protein
MESESTILIPDTRVLDTQVLLDEVYLLYLPNGRAQVTFLVGWIDVNHPFPFPLYTLQSIPGALYTGNFYPGPHDGWFAVFSPYRNGELMGKAIVFVPAGNIEVPRPFNVIHPPVEIHWDC